MARPKRPFNGSETVDVVGYEYMEKHLPKSLGVRQKNRWDASRNWAYRTPNGQYDPLTYLLVLDSVANMYPDIELRASNLVKWLDEHCTQFTWDSVTVGKVLSDLCDSFEGVLGAKRGILERGKDYRGAFYLLHHDAATAGLYAKARDDLMKLSQVEMDERRAGRRPQRLASPLIECPSLRGEWVDA